LSFVELAAPDLFPPAAPAAGALSSLAEAEALPSF